MTKDFATCIWETLDVTKASDTSNPLVFEREAVELDSKNLYIPKWRIKPKDLTAIQLEGDVTKPSSVVLTVVTNEITVRLIHVLNDSEWKKFLKRLEGFAKRSNVQLQMPSSYLSEKKTNFESGKVPTTRPDTSAFLKSTGNSRFSPSRPGRRQQTNNQFTSPSRTRRIRGTFGKKPRLTPTKSPAVEWSDNESDDLIVRPFLVETSKRRGKLLYLSDDDRVQVEAHDEDKVVIGTDEEDNDESLFDNVPSRKAKRKVIDDSDDDQDNTVKGKPSPSTTSATTTFTPPRTQIRVSPASRTQEKSSESLSRQQPRLDNFFAPKTAVAVSSFDPTKRANKIASTPVRISTTSVKKSNQSNRTSGGWLQRSKAGTASPLKERQKMLFGSTKKGITTPKKDDDPVEEYPSPPTTRNPMDLLDQAPLQKRLDLHHAATSTGVAHKRKRAYSNSYTTPPPRRRLSLDAAAPKKADETVLVPRSPWQGLRNLGNTCYLNSSIQMLVTLVGTTTGKTNDWWDGLRGRGGPLTKSLIDVVDQLMMPPRIGMLSAVNPSQVKNAIDAITDKFAGYEQRDAHEFLSDLIDSVHEELDKDSPVARGEGTLGAPHTKASPNPASRAGDDENETVKQNPLPTDDFRLTVEVCLSCESCGYERKKTEIYRHLSVDIMSDNGNQMGSIANGLNHFFEPEVLEIRCEKCAQGSHAKRSLRILSRYVYFGYFFRACYASFSLMLCVQSKIFAVAPETIHLYGTPCPNW